MRWRDEDAKTEMRLLVLASRPRETPADTSAIHDLLRQPVDWTSLIEGALRHGVTPQVVGRLVSAAETELPPELAEAARVHLSELRERNRTIIGEFGAILDALRRTGIEAIPLKGPVLAQLLYGDATARAFRDLDFLVRRADAERTISVLAELGYREFPDPANLSPRHRTALYALRGQTVLWKADALAPVEPHWTLAPANLRLALDLEGMWRRSQPIVFADREIRAPAPSDLVLTVAIHGGKDEWSRLQSVCDLAHAVLSLSPLDWPMILGSAREQRCLRMLLSGMRLSEDLMGTELPAEVAAALADEPEAATLARVAAGRILSDDRTDHPMFEVSRFRFRLHDRWLDRLHYVAMTILTPREQHLGLVRLPDRLFFLYCPLKFVHDYILLPAWLLLKRMRGPTATR